MEFLARYERDTMSLLESSQNTRGGCVHEPSQKLHSEGGLLVWRSQGRLGTKPALMQGASRWDGQRRPAASKRAHAFCMQDHI